MKSPIKLNKILDLILTVKFFPAAVTIITSPFKAKSSGDNCDVSREAAKISCKHNLASK